MKVDSQVDRSAELSAQLAESKSFLAIAEERKEQLEKQLVNARLLLKQSGLDIDSLPKDRVPTLDGQVIAVFVILLAAAEAAVALAITLNFYNNHATVDVDRADDLKG